MCNFPGPRGPGNPGLITLAGAGNPWGLGKRETQNLKEAPRKPSHLVGLEGFRSEGL